VSATPAPALAARSLSKRFGGVLALDGAGLEVLPGEIHALLGANGSGKSTLIKILAGYHAPEPGGELEVRGVPVTLPLRPGEARAVGLAFVHQDLALIPSLSVLENLRLGELAARRGWYLPRRPERERACRALERLGVDLDPDARVGALAPLDRALLAVVRAVEEMPGAGVLVLDEPTAFLPRRETERLVGLLRGIAGGGASVLLVSHDLAEVRRIADRVTVLRDGRNVGTEAGDAAEKRLVELILGRALAPLPTARGGGRGQVAVRLGSVSGRALRDVSLELGAGEVVGLTGLAGSGYAELAYALFGASPGTTGRIELNGSAYDLAALTPAQALAAGAALVPADRLRDGSVGSLPVADNLALPVLGSLGRRLLLRPGRLVRHAASLLARFDVRPRDPRLPYGALSGGNQQKALLAKSLQARPRLLLLDEPTQGADVGAHRQILALVAEAAAEGAAVLYASADHKELAAVCDRVLVFAGGRVAHELAGADLTEERIGRLTLAASPA
jgi:ribose transport system ATP-binding protein